MDVGADGGAPQEAADDEEVGRQLALGWRWTRGCSPLAGPALCVKMELCAVCRMWSCFWHVQRARARCIAHCAHARAASASTCVCMHMRMRMHTE